MQGPEETNKHTRLFSDFLSDGKSFKYMTNWAVTMPESLDVASRLVESSLSRDERRTLTHQTRREGLRHKSLDRPSYRAEIKK